MIGMANVSGPVPFPADDINARLQVALQSQQKSLNQASFVNQGIIDGVSKQNQEQRNFQKKESYGKTGGLIGGIGGAIAGGAIGATVSGGLIGIIPGALTGALLGAVGGGLLGKLAYSAKEMLGGKSEETKPSGPVGGGVNALYGQYANPNVPAGYTPAPVMPANPGYPNMTYGPYSYSGGNNLGGFLGANGSAV